jgi:hypothetical protein
MRVKKDHHSGGHEICARLRGSSEAFEAGGGVERLQIFNPYGIELVPRSKKNRDFSC